MQDFYYLCQNEMVDDISHPLASILQDSGGSHHIHIQERIAEALSHNQDLHYSKITYVHYFKNRWLKDGKRACKASNYPSLVAALTEGLVHDIDNRLDGHAVSVLNSCFLETYAPLIIQRALLVFSRQNKKLQFLSDLYWKHLMVAVMDEQFDFLNRIHQIPLLEHTIANGAAKDPSRNLQQLLEIRCRISTIGVTLIFLPMVLLKQCSKKNYQDILLYFNAVHIIDGLLKDYQDIKDDERNGRFNTWLVLKNAPSNCRLSYIEYVQKSIDTLDLFDAKVYPSLAEYFQYFLELRQQLLASLTAI